jgi:hypothetical protein
MGIQKSDAMLQHEKWIQWVTEHNPKWVPDMEDKPVNLMPEAHTLIGAFTVVLVLMAVFLSMV